MFKDHFEQGISWDDTTEYENLFNKLQQNGSIGTLDLPSIEQTVEILNEYYDYVDELYYDISENWYKPQSDLESSDDFENRTLHPSLDEIQVAIDLRAYCWFNLATTDTLSRSF